jgi:hypothetical protein
MEQFHLSIPPQLTWFCVFCRLIYSPPMICRESSPPVFSPEIEAKLCADLKLLHAMALRDAASIAVLPHTWQHAAHGLDCKGIAWRLDPAMFNSTWHPVFREGVNRKLATDALIAFCQTGNGCALRAAKYLALHFSGASIQDLRSRLAEMYRSNRARQFERWWSSCPVPVRDATSVNLFNSRAQLAERSGINVYSCGARVVSMFYPQLRVVLERFFSTERPAESRETGENSSSFFKGCGTLEWPAPLRASLRDRLRPMATAMTSAVAIDSQLDPWAVLSYLVTNLPSELLHEAQCYLGGMQEKLIGKMALSGFPLLYWRDVAQGATASSELPEGRRSEITPPEGAAIYAALYQIVDQGKVWLNNPDLGKDLKPTPKSPYRTSDQMRADLKASIAARTEMSTGRLGFEHISALRLKQWVDACDKLLEHADLPQHAWGISVYDMQAARARFVEESQEIHSLLYLLLLKNNGLVGKLASQYCSVNDSFGNSHDSQNVYAFVREEMLRSIASFDYRKGSRFSTYAVNRIKFQLRRSPQMERQLVKLSSDQTTTQARLHRLAKSSELEENDPDYFGDIADRYNEQFAKGGRTRVLPYQVQELLRVGRLVFVGPSDDDDDDSPAPVQLAAAPGTSSTPTPQDIINDLNTIRARVSAHTPQEGLALALLLRASPYETARARFNRSLLDDSKQRIAGIINRQARRVDSKGSDPASRRVLITRGNLSEKAIRTKQGDEIARDERRGVVRVAD